MSFLGLEVKKWILFTKIYFSQCVKKILSFTLFRGRGGWGLDQKCESSHFFYFKWDLPLLICVSSWLLDWWIEWTGHFLMQKILVLLLSLSCFINHVHCTIKHILLDRSWLYLFQEINLRFKNHWWCKTFLV